MASTSTTTLPNATHIVVNMSDSMDLNIVTREGGVVLPRVELEIEGDWDDELEEDELSPEEVAALEEQLKDLKVKKGEGEDGDEEWEDEDEDDDDDVTPLKPTLECTIEPEHAPAIYKTTTVLDLEDLVFPASLAGVAALAPHIETVRIKSVPSSGYIGEWPFDAKNLVVFHEQMLYEYGPWGDSDDEDDDEDEDEDDEEDEEEKKAAEDKDAKTEENGEKDEKKDDAEEEDEEDADEDEDEDDILCTSRFVLNITPSHPTTPRVTKALEQMIKYLAPTLEEIIIIFNVDKEYKQPKDYTPAADEYEPPLLLFLLTLLTMCASDTTKITFVDFDKTGAAWLGDDSLRETIAGATDMVPPEVAQKVFEEFLSGGLDEVREDAKADGLGDVGTKRNISYLSRDAYKATVGDEQFALDTKWEK